MVMQILRIVAVVALLCAAAALATPRGRLPLVLRGVLSIMRRDRGETASGGEVRPVSAWRKLAAFLAAVAAAVLAMI